MDGQRIVLAMCKQTEEVHKMRISAMTCILLCSVPVGVIQVQEEATPASPFFPDVTTLPGVELQPLLEKWDAALEIEDYPERHYALPTVSRIVPQDMRFRGATVLRYDNPEIIDRVVNLFLEECVKHDEMTTEKQSKRNNPWHWAEGAEYLYDLGSTAQSTFDPRIYKTVLNPPGCYLGGLRELYLATVNPEQTLAYLLESKRGGLTGTGHPDYFRLTHDGTVPKCLAQTPRASTGICDDVYRSLQRTARSLLQTRACLQAVRRL